MPPTIQGLHHVTALASDARANNVFFTELLGLRRVKKTVNFDAPDVYHLYYGDAAGTPGSVMTYFPFPHAARGRPGTGEVSCTTFAVPMDGLDWWADRLGTAQVEAARLPDPFGADRLAFAGPDGEALALIEDPDDTRAGWTGTGIGIAHAIRGFHSVALRLVDSRATQELLTLMGYAPVATEGPVIRMACPGGRANAIDLVSDPGAEGARQGAGSVHHVAFSVADRAAQREMQTVLQNAGVQVTPVIDRDYFWAIYFHSPSGVLFEIATDEPGFDRDEARDTLGSALKLPSRHEHLRAALERHLPQID